MRPRFGQPGHAAALRGPSLALGREIGVGDADLCHPQAAAQLQVSAGYAGFDPSTGHRLRVLSLRPGQRLALGRLQHRAGQRMLAGGLQRGGQRQQLAGNTFRLTSRRTYSLGATFSGSFGPAGRIQLTPSYQYKSKHFFDDNNANASYRKMRNVRCGPCANIAKRRRR